MVDEETSHLKELLLEKFASRDKELKLQATEYERRLNALNHENERIQTVQELSVTQEKFDSYVSSQEAARVREKEAREIALDRVDEKFNDYVKRQEARQIEFERALASQKAAAEKIATAAESSADAATRIVEQQGRAFNRNLGIATFVLAAFVAFANGILPGA